MLQGKSYIDPESLEELPLVPGLSKTENLLRWGFVQKVYGIIGFQLLLTAAVCLVIYSVQPVQNFILNSIAFQITFAILPLIGKFQALRLCTLPSFDCVFCLPLTGFNSFVLMYLCLLQKQCILAELYCTSMGMRKGRLKAVEQG